MTSEFAMRNIKGYLVVTEEILSFRRQTTEDKNKEIIDLYLSQMLDAAMWQSTFTKITGADQTRTVVRGAGPRATKIYKECVYTKTGGVLLLFKFFLYNIKKRYTKAN